MGLEGILIVFGGIFIRSASNWIHLHSCLTTSHTVTAELCHSNWTRIKTLSVNLPNSSCIFGDSKASWFFVCTRNLVDHFEEWDAFIVNAYLHSRPYRHACVDNFIRAETSGDNANLGCWWIVHQTSRLWASPRQEPINLIIIDCWQWRKWC